RGVFIRFWKSWWRTSASPPRTVRARPSPSTPITCAPRWANWPRKAIFRALFCEALTFQQHVECAAAAILHARVGDGEYKRPQLRPGQPMRRFSTNATFAPAAFTRNDDHQPRAARMHAADKRRERPMGALQRHAM